VLVRHSGWFYYILFLVSLQAVVRKDIGPCRVETVVLHLRLSRIGHDLLYRASKRDRRVIDDLGFELDAIGAAAESIDLAYDNPLAGGIIEGELLALAIAELDGLDIGCIDSVIRKIKTIGPGGKVEQCRIGIGSQNNRVGGSDILFAILLQSQTLQAAAT